MKRSLQRVIWKKAEVDTRRSITRPLGNWDGSEGVADKRWCTFGTLYDRCMLILNGGYKFLWLFLFLCFFFRIFCGTQKLMVLWNSVSKCGPRSAFENIGLSSFKQPNFKISWIHIVLLPLTHLSHSSVLYANFLNSE